MYLGMNIMNRNTNLNFMPWFYWHRSIIFINVFCINFRFGMNLHIMKARKMFFRVRTAPHYTPKINFFPHGTEPHWVRKVREGAQVWKFSYMSGKSCIKFPWKKILKLHRYLVGVVGGVILDYTRPALRTAWHFLAWISPWKSDFFQCKFSFSFQKTKFHKNNLGNLGGDSKQNRYIKPLHNYDFLH